MKLVVTPIMMIICESLFDGINYINIYDSIFIGIGLAIVLQLIEIVLLTRETFWMNNIIDFIVIFVTIYGSQFIFSNAIITVNGVFLSAILMFIAEYYQHRYLIHTARVIK